MTIFAKEVVLKGFVILNNEKLDYEISYEVKDNHKIIGQSITSLPGGEPAYSEILGVIDYTQNRFVFKETKNIGNGHQSFLSTYCFFEGVFAYKNNNGQIEVTGHVMGSDTKGHHCGEGELYLLSSKPARPLTPPPVIKPQETPTATTPQPTNIDTLASDFLIGNNTYVYKTNSRQLTIKYSDFSNYDGDSISIFSTTLLLYLPMV